MKNFLNDNIKSLLGITVVLSVIGYFYMCSLRDIKPDQQITIAFVAALSMVLGYYYGSSSGSAKKDDTLNTIATQPTVTQSGDSPTVNVDAPK